MDMIFDTVIDGLPLRTGDIICTTDGNEDSVVGRFWRALGHLVPGEIDHVVLYVGPGGRCVEAGAKGVIEFEMPEGRWDAAYAADQRWLIDSLVGVAYPLANRSFATEEEQRVRSEVARYCLEQAEADKPYNVNFFDPATDAAFYCSQLIYKAYLSCGIDLTEPPHSDRAASHNHVPLVLPQIIWQNCVHSRVADTELQARAVPSIGEHGRMP